LLHDVTDDAAGGRQVPHRVTADPAWASAQSSSSGSDEEHAVTYDPVQVLPRGGVPVIVEHHA
jgi:hypothetical protein